MWRSHAHIAPATVATCAGKRSLLLYSDVTPTDSSDSNTPGNDSSQGGTRMCLEWYHLKIDVFYRRG